MNKIKSFLLESADDPTKWSRTLKGIMVMLAPILIGLLKVAISGFTEADFNSLLDSVAGILDNVALIIGFGVSIYGLWRKYYVKVLDQKPL
jgi:hypothetical protein